MAGGGGGCLTIFAAVDPQALVLPDDEGRRRADHVADDDGVVALVELLRTGRVLEGDLLCGGDQGEGGVGQQQQHLTSHTQKQLELFPSGNTETSTTGK